MSSPAILCHNDRRSFQTVKNRFLVVKETDPKKLKTAAENVARSGNHLLSIVVPTDSLDRFSPQEDWLHIPIVVIPRSFGAFRNFEPHIDLMRRLDIKVHLPCNSAANIQGLKILSSLGIHTTAMIWTEDPDWESLADLAAYALLSPASHAPMEPFAYIAQHYRPSRYIDWEFIYFEDPKRFVRMDERGRVNAIPSGLNQKRPADRDHVCHGCAGWNMCHCRFMDGAHAGDCADFFLDMVDNIERATRKNRPPEFDAGRNAPSGKDEIVKLQCETAPDGPKKSDPDTPAWIDLKGGATEALILSSVLKQIIEKDPSQRYALVSRSQHGPVLAGHPAILQTGYPSKDAKILHIGPVAAGMSSGFTSYQAIARDLGREIPVEETIYVPWEFEDDPILVAMVPRKETNVLIITGNGPGQGMSSNEWESLVRMLAKEDVPVIQAGNARDAYIRGAYDIRGVLEPRQLISLPRHFNAVVTTDTLVLYACRLCSTPAVILTGQDTVLPKYDNQVHIQNPRAKALYNEIKKII